MKTAIISSLMVGVLAIASGSSSAAEAKNTKDLNPWQDCGIGAMVFPANGVAAAISNIIWDLGTTAVTSNVSSQNSCNSEKAKTAMFIKATLPALEQDVATGEGEYLTAMLEIRGCDASSHRAIVEAVRQDLIQKTADNAEALYNVVENRVTANFANVCTSA
jgi:hypothetical protein